MAHDDQRFEDLLFSREHVQDRPVKSMSIQKGQRAVRFHESVHHAPRQLADPLLGSSNVKPGSRRYKRVMKNLELLATALSDSEGEDFEIEVEYTVEFRSPFSVIFDDEVFRKKWDPFVEITEEEETNLLAMMDDKQAFRKGKMAAGESANPINCWKNLTKYAKEILLANAESPMIGVLDQMLIDFILTSEPQKTYILTSHFQCLLCHCVAAFYSMKACTTKDNHTYYTTISRTKSTRLPTTLLTEFLENKSKVR